MRRQIFVGGEVLFTGNPTAAEAGVHPVVASAARELLNKSRNERSGVLSTAMSFLGLARLERAVGIAVETLALFIRLWLTTTPSLPEPAAKAARARAGACYDNFVAALGSRLSQGSKLRQEIPEDLEDAERGAAEQT